jgi:hypothetical protein
MQRITVATAKMAEELADRHGMARNQLMERIMLWVGRLDHESQQLVLGTLAPERAGEVARRISEHRSGA